MPVIMEGVLRAVLAFIMLWVLVRVMGKENQTGLTFFDYVAGITVGGIIALMAAGLNVNLWGVVASLLTFITLLVLNGYLSLNISALRKPLRNEPVMVLYKGEVLEGNVAQTRYTAEDLLNQIREKGFDEISRLEAAIVDKDGQLDVIAKKGILNK